VNVEDVVSVEDVVIGADTVSVADTKIVNNVEKDAVAEDIIIKEKSLARIISEYDSMLVAFSGGVDSSLLLDVAHSILGERVLAVTSHSCSFPQRERLAAAAFCASRNITHLEIDSEELNVEGFSDNPPNRCYLCKRELFSKILCLAKKRGVAVVAEGSNLSDEGDYRPGLQAISELGILSPLRLAGLTKDDVRILSRQRKLPTWDKPAFACLASRVPYGVKISASLLERIDAAEEFLINKGFTQVRVRAHGDVARIEVDSEKITLLASEHNRIEIYEYIHKLGFAHVAVDLAGYRTGSMNDSLISK
jgi:uncharacterized protein